MGNAGERYLRIEPQQLRFRDGRQACLDHLAGSDNVDTITLAKSLI